VTRCAGWHQAHRLLGCVVAAREPPPYLLLADAAESVDSLGLLELLRRRCARIIVCDATQDPPGAIAAEARQVAAAHRGGYACSRGGGGIGEGGLGGGGGGEPLVEEDACWALLRVLDAARKEVQYLSGVGVRARLSPTHHTHPASSVSLSLLPLFHLPCLPPSAFPTASLSLLSPDPTIHLLPANYRCHPPCSPPTCPLLPSVTRLARRAAPSCRGTAAAAMSKLQSGNSNSIRIGTVEG